MRNNRPEEGQSRAERPKRIPLTRQNLLNAGKREGYVRRWVNDVDDRIDRFKLAGWEPVTDIKQVGDPHVGDPKGLGSMATKSVGAGVKAILMEIPEDIYREDQEQKQDKVDQMENAMERDIRNQLGGSAYGEGIKISRNRS